MMFVYKPPVEVTYADMLSWIQEGLGGGTQLWNISAWDSPAEAVLRFSTVLLMMLSLLLVIMSCWSLKVLGKNKS
jgi:hypothetical protein